MNKLIVNANHRDTLWRLSIAIILIAFLASCTPSAPAAIPRTYWPTDGWRSTAPEEQGMDSEKLVQMVEHIQQEKLDLHSLLIVRNGYLVSELYVYPYSDEQVHATMSVTKSVIGTLVGIAIQKGYIKDIHQPVSELLPDQNIANLDEEKKSITLENFLTMTSGLDCHENPAPGEPFMQTSENWVQFVIDLPMAAQPGTKFNYCTSAIEVLSAVLQESTGMSAREFANEHLFGPIGIDPIPEARWPSDPQQITIGGYGLTLYPREMAKFGYLFLNQGQWDGKTIVPSKWVSASTTSHANLGDKKEYGYLWWIDPQGKWYAALGRAGQHIFIYPSEDLVVVFTAGLPYYNDADFIPLQALLDEYILPAVKSDQPLPANPTSQARLESGIRALVQPERTVPSPLPSIANKISEKTYVFEDNPFGWHLMSFTFEDGADEATLAIDDFPQVAIGLDNVYRIFSLDDGTFPQGFRGHWEKPDTFVVEAITLGQIEEFNYRIQFPGDTIQMFGQEKYSGSKIEAQGTLSPLTN